MPDYREIDNSPALSYIFYPRNSHSKPPRNAFDKSIPVAEDVAITCRFYKGDDDWHWIVFFHGNGEVVSDYDTIAPLYTKHKLNLVVADYRGYGSSGGNPTLTDLVHDAPILFKAIKEELSQRGKREDVWLMGRSLGSISALELAYRFPDQIRGLIVESGFPCITKLIMHLGLPAGAIDLNPIYESRISMVRKITTPTLIIHGEFDMLVPLREAENLYNEIGAKDKELVIISGADHNDIMFFGLDRYFGAIQTFIERTGAVTGDE
jgi:pimeloyl-ACP methyl ester carboxylesterase